MKNLKMKGEMKLKVRKRLKMLVALVLIFSILCADSNLSLYANDSQETEAMEESFAGQADAQTVTEDAASEEMVSEDAVSEETVSEEVESEEASAEETATEEADYFEVDLNETAVADSGGITQRAVGENYDQVCTGGSGGKHGGDNHNPTGLPNQNVDKKTAKFYDPNGNNMNKTMTEQQWIDRYWSKNKGEALGKETIADAVIDPEDDCYYANKLNGFGEHVGKNQQYLKYNVDWTQRVEWKTQSTPKANKHPTKPNTNYTGNYIYTGYQSGWQNTLTIVSNSKVEIGTRRRYYLNPDVDRRFLPILYDTTNHFGMGFVTSSEKNTYIFKLREGGNISYRDQFPAKMGKYTLEAQYNPDAELFRLPAIITKDIEVYPKGYLTSFVMGTEFDNAQPIKDNEWHENQKPTPFDQETEQVFGTDLYLENSTNKIPIPKYDENKYIFEGWKVYEEYVDENDGFSIKTSIRDLQKDSDGTYSYVASQIGENATYVLETVLFADLRIRKTFEANVEIQTIDGSAIVDDALNVKTVKNNTEQDVTIHEYTKGIEDNTEFTASVKTNYGYEFVGWSDPNSTDYKKYGNGNFKPTVEWNKQTEQNKKQSFKANFKAKPYRIVFEGNGGQLPNGDNEHVQSTTYYKDTSLDVNKFVRDGYTFLGWSRTKNGSVEFQNSDIVNNLPIRSQGDNTSNSSLDFPEEITLYAVWQSPHATVSIEDSKDTIWIEGYKNKAIASGIYTQGSNQNYTVYEVIRFYLDIDTTDNLDQSKLDKSKFYVVWERSKDGGKTYEKISPTNTSGFFTKAFSDNQWNGFRKAVFDEEKQQWFVPLFIRNNHYPSKDSFYGTYRVNVAYDDPKATEKVTSENDFYNESGNTGWTTSNPVEVKVIQTFETVVSIPASVTLENKTESNPDGTTKEVIQSTHTSNKVTVNQIEHSLTGKTDYDWNTPNTTMNNTTNGNTYWNSLYKEYTRKKPFEVSINWDKTLSDSTSQYTIPNIEMYSAANLGSMTKDKPIATGTKATFSYDGTEQNKTLFDFYLKGDKPANLPHGTTFKGVITFRFTNI